MNKFFYLLLLHNFMTMTAMETSAQGTFYCMRRAVVINISVSKTIFCITYDTNRDSVSVKKQDDSINNNVFCFDKIYETIDLNNHEFKTEFLDTFSKMLDQNNINKNDKNSIRDRVMPIEIFAEMLGLLKKF